MVADGGKDQCEALKAGPGSKSLHRPFSFSERNVRIFRSIVEPLVAAMLYAWHDDPLCGRVGSELVGDYASGLSR